MASATTPTITIALAFTIDDAPKVYVERIDIVGNTRTRDYVIRREFDIGEGDPYNHALIERGERRLNNLGFFKTVHISNRPGSSPDRVIVVVDVEDKPTGSIAISGGYSTHRRRRSPKSRSPRRTFSAAANIVRLSAPRTASTANGWSVSFTEPYFLDQRLAGGFDIYHKQQLQNTYALYQNWTTGVNLRLGVPVTDELTFQPQLFALRVADHDPEHSSRSRTTIATSRSRSAGVTPGDVSTPFRADRHRQLLDQRRSFAGDQAGGGARRQSSPRWPASR